MTQIQKNVTGTKGPDGAQFRKPVSTNPKELARMLENVDPKERLAAVERLAGNWDALMYVADNINLRDVKAKAIEKLVLLIETKDVNEDTLKSLAMHCRHIAVSVAAVQKINAPEILEDISLNALNADAKSAASAKLATIDGKDSEFVTGLIAILMKTEV